MAPDAQHGFRKNTVYSLAGNRVVLGRLLGDGTEGRVYSAILPDRTPGPDGQPRSYALKVSTDVAGINPEFGREADVVGTTTFKNSIVPYGPLAFEAEGKSYDAMLSQRVLGQNLHSYYYARPAPSTGEVAGAMSQIARALNDAHQKGFVHLDVKPGNAIREAATGKVVLIDWGMVEKVGTAPRDYAVGTDYYMSPEMARGRSTIAPSMDVYSAGVMTAELANKRHFRDFPDDLEPHEILNQVAETKVQPHVADPLLNLAVQRATHPDAARRGTALDMMTDLVAWPEGREHFDADDLQQVTQNLVRRASEWSRRMPSIDAAAARGLLETLPNDHPRRGALTEIARLAPVPTPAEQPAAAPAAQLAQKPPRPSPLPPSPQGPRR